MSREQYARTAMLLGDEAIEKLRHSRVAVFGVGGVGGYVCEALARCGVGALDLVDHDTVSESNLNRQIIALHSTIGRYKVDVMAERIRDIDPETAVTVHPCFYLPETEAEFDFGAYDYVVDAVDTMKAKIALVMRCHEAGVPVISSMGAGNKLDGSRFSVKDLFDTSGDPLARTMRHELRKRGIDRLKVVCSDEPPITPRQPAGQELPKGKRTTPGSIAFIPSVAGLLIAGEVVLDLCGVRNPD